MLLQVRKLARRHIAYMAPPIEIVGAYERSLFLPVSYDRFSAPLADAAGC
jgi:hypothetical protein